MVTVISELCKLTFSYGYKLKCLSDVIKHVALLSGINWYNLYSANQKDLELI